jgi:putative addiction module component (TIGR02574 family)
MKNDIENLDFSSLSLAERVLLAEKLWDSVACDEAQSKMPVPTEHEQELRQRMLAEDAGKIDFSPWSEAKKRLLEKK